MLLKKVKVSVESFSDDELLESVVVSWLVCIGRFKVFVKYFEEESDSDDKENEGLKEWFGLGSDFDDD